MTTATTSLQIAIGVLMRDSKCLLKHVHDYGVTCSYDELRFRKSAAVAAASDVTHQAISDATQGLVQVVADNFECDISSPNGKTSTHSLAMIIMQPSLNQDDTQAHDIPRLKKTEMNQNIDNNETVIVYNGSKNPPMPDVSMQTRSADDAYAGRVSQQRSDDINFSFFNDMVK